MMSNKHHNKNKQLANKKQLTSYLSIVLAFVVSVYIGFNLSNKTASAEEIMVYKSPTCGCCKKWVKHLEKEGFNVTTKDYSDMKPIKQMMGVKPQY